ncbi:flagellar motor switch protein FliN [Thermosulfurimonas sp. F29]|uniref:flagellar motor switch protein FliN n=1 Tax=Thermosulfurimonas sp. F29 TaxID=2867247 RepID=UPI001C839791|nr:flagellar motor switch protein FliN [Thermosulfurimonas sp. F29]MBX6423608.1 flagellar motor switch protein FliN [Thermosulfurimonas sp. F29]
MSEDLREETREDLGQEASQESEVPSGTPEAGEETAGEGASGEKSGEGSSEEDLMAMWEEALKEAGGEGGSDASSSEDSPEEAAPAGEAIEVAQPELKEFKEAPAEGPHPDLEFILDIPLEVWVEIGRTKMPINDLLKLTQGSIIELNKMAGEPVEIYVNGKLMGRGEVVVVNDRFGVRLTEILSPQERIRKLGE